MYGKKRTRVRELPPYVIGFNEKDNRGYVVGVWFAYFKSEKARRDWCVKKLERSPWFAGYFGRMNFE